MIRDHHDARAVRDFVFNRLNNAETIVVNTLRTDLQGIHLNAESITEGHAVLAVMWQSDDPSRCT